MRNALSGNAYLKTIILFIVFGLLPLALVSQVVSFIDLKEIPQKKVRKFIKSGAFDKMHDFSLIHSSWKKDAIESDFRIIEKTFNLKVGHAIVWNTYRHANSMEMWNSRSVKLGLLISKRTNTVTYNNNDFSPEIDTGQVYFLRLRLLKGLLNLPVAFEIIKINHEEEIIEFSYLEKNKSKGKQTIHFIDVGNGVTNIVHKTYFKSGSMLRDDLYPFFHKRFIKEFHRNMNRKMNLQPNPLKVLMPPNPPKGGLMRGS